MAGHLRLANLKDVRLYLKQHGRNCVLYSPALAYTRGIISLDSANVESALMIADAPQDPGSN